MHWTADCTTHHHVVPLVQLDGKVSVGLDPLGVGRVHHCLAGWPHRYGLGQVRVPGLGHPGNLGGEVGDVVLLLLQGSVGHEDGEITILDSELLDLGVEEVPDGLPDSEGPGTEDVAAGDVVVLHHLGLGEDLGVPVGQVLLLLGLNTQPRLTSLGSLGLSNKIK